MRYQNETKKTWRNWVWNQMARRLSKGSKVIVFAGQLGADLEAAKRRGLEAVAVDMDEECVANYRRKGGIAIQDKFHRVAVELSEVASGCILDEMGGLTDASYTNCILGHLFDVVAVNYLRGRDKKGAELCRKAEALGLCVSQYNTHREKRVPIKKSRAKAMWMTLAIQACDARSEKLTIDFGSPHYIPHESLEFKWRDIADFERKCSKQSRPCFNSYRSEDGNLFYDSGVWNTWFKLKDPALQLSNTPRCNKTRRKARAVKALLTMKESTVRK